MTKPQARVYVPAISVFTLAAGGGYIVFGAALAIGVGAALHWLAGLVIAVVLSGAGWVACESHAASQRVPSDVFAGRGSAGFSDPEDDQPTARVRSVEYGPGASEPFSDGGDGW